MEIILKYIITDHGAIVFNEGITQVANGFPKVYSAGFVTIRNGQVLKVFGGSSSMKMKIKSQAKDRIIIADIFSPLSQIKYHLFNIKEFYEHD